ncbi:hypothetical protein TYRP_022538 [Tyrophagus putrescentiae]|nr:hypothetical protein TYRP_022538 [Tyrophagus putrescentiae]
MALNLLRFLLIVALSQPSLSVEEESGQTKNRNYYLYSFLRSLLCEYFAGNQYGYLFHFVTASTLITPTSIYFCACLLFCLDPSVPYVGVTLLFPFAKEKEKECHFLLKSIPGENFRHLTQYMRLLELFRLFIVFTVTLPCFLLTVFDLHFEYQIKELIWGNPFKLMLILAWDYVFVSTIVQMVQMTGVLFAHVFCHIYLFKARFLTTTFAQFLRLSGQLRWLNGAAYFFGIFSLEYELFLLVHAGTPFAMRSCAIVFFGLVLTMLTTVYTFYSRFHAKVKVTSEIGQKLLLAEKEAVFADDLVGMNIAAIFIMTRQCFFSGVITFVSYFLLLLSLTEV